MPNGPPVPIPAPDQYSRPGPPYHPTPPSKRSTRSNPALRPTPPPQLEYDRPSSQPQPGKKPKLKRHRSAFTAVGSAEVLAPVSPNAMASGSGSRMAPGPVTKKGGLIGVVVPNAQSIRAEAPSITTTTNPSTAAPATTSNTSSIAEFDPSAPIPIPVPRPGATTYPPSTSLSAVAAAPPPSPQRVAPTPSSSASTAKPQPSSSSRSIIRPAENPLFLDYDSSPPLGPDDDDAGPSTTATNSVRFPSRLEPSSSSHKVGGPPALQALLPPKPTVNSSNPFLTSMGAGYASSEADDDREEDDEDGPEPEGGDEAVELPKGPAQAEAEIQPEEEPALQIEDEGDESEDELASYEETDPLPPLPTSAALAAQSQSQSNGGSTSADRSPEDGPAAQLPHADMAVDVVDLTGLMTSSQEVPLAAMETDEGMDLEDELGLGAGMPVLDEVDENGLMGIGLSVDGPVAIKDEPMEAEEEEGDKTVTPEDVLAQAPEEEGPAEGEARGSKRKRADSTADVVPSFSDASVEPDVKAEDDDVAMGEVDVDGGEEDGDGDEGMESEDGVEGVDGEEENDSFLPVVDEPTATAPEAVQQVDAGDAPPPRKRATRRVDVFTRGRELAEEKARQEAEEDERLREEMRQEMDAEKERIGAKFIAWIRKDDRRVEAMEKQRVSVLRKEFDESFREQKENAKDYGELCEIDIQLEKDFYRQLRLNVSSVIGPTDEDEEGRNSDEEEDEQEPSSDIATYADVTDCHLGVIPRPMDEDQVFLWYNREEEDEPQRTLMQRDLMVSHPTSEMYEMQEGYRSRNLQDRLETKRDIRKTHNNITKEFELPGDWQSFKWRLVDRLGEGTFSSVYKAVDLERCADIPVEDFAPLNVSGWLHEDPARLVTSSRNKLIKKGREVVRDGDVPYVALKRIYVTSSPARISNELEIMEDLKGCRNVSELLTAFRLDDQVYAVMPFHANDDFRLYYKHLDPPHIRLYVRCLLRALKDIHRRGIVHRDVKPANFLFEYESGVGYLCDFGLAERYQPPSKILCQHSAATYEMPHGARTRTLATSKVEQAVYDARKRVKGGLVGVPQNENRPSMKANRAGTRGFRAPEVLLKCPDQTVAIDIWAAGIMLLSILCQKFPLFNSNDDVEALLELGSVFGRQALEKCGVLHNRTLLSNLPFTNANPPSLTDIILKLNPNLYTPPSPYSTSEEAEAHILRVDSMLDLLKQLLKLDPTKRITAHQALMHPFMQEDLDEEDMEKEEVCWPIGEGECKAKHRVHRGVHSIKDSQKQSIVMGWGQGRAHGDKACPYHSSAIRHCYPQHPQ